MKTSRIISVFTVLIIVTVALTFNSCEEKEPPPPMVGAAPCPDSVTDSQDGNVYSVVQIGNQCWMQQNLVLKNDVLCYDNNDSICAIYGCLYTFEEASKACINGWHLPSLDEWRQLIDFLGGDSVAGGKMKETGFAHWNSPNTGATNSSGFTALPGGMHISPTYVGIGVATSFWSSTFSGYHDAWAVILDYSNNSIHIVDKNPEYWSYSVRCVKN